MRISEINSNYNVNNKYKNPNFKNLIKDPSAIPVIKSMTEKEILEFNKIDKQLSKTKFWDIKISSIGNAFKEFKFNFINKNNKSIITDGIYPYNQKGKTISFYSIIYGPENTSLNTIETLSFKSEKRAKELYNKYQNNLLYARNRGYNISPVESLKMKKVELRMLEEACDNINGKHDIAFVNTELQTKKKTGNNLLLNG